MSQRDKDAAAELLIDAFAAQLLELNGGAKIPAHWNIRLKKMLAPKKKKPGPPQDLTKVAEAVKLMALAGDKVRTPRTKHHNPAVYKDEIAKKLKTSRRNLERIGGVKDISQLDELPDELRKAHIDGLSAAIGERLQDHFKAEQEARENEARRRIERALKKPE